MYLRFTELPIDGETFHKTAHLGKLEDDKQGSSSKEVSDLSIKWVAT